MFIWESKFILWTLLVSCLGDLGDGRHELDDRGLFFLKGDDSEDFFFFFMKGDDREDYLERVFFSHWMD